MNNYIVSSSVLLAVLVAVPSYASTTDVSVPISFDEGVRAQPYAPPKLTDDEGERLKRSMDTESALNLFVHDQSIDPRKPTSAEILSKHDKTIKMMEEKLHLALAYKLAASTFENFQSADGLKPGAGASIYYLGNKNALAIVAIHKDLNVQTDAVNLICSFLGEQSKAGLQKKYDCVRDAWSKLLDAYQNGNSMPAYGQAIESLSKAKKELDDLLAQPLSLLHCYEQQCGEVVNLLKGLVKIRNMLSAQVRVDAFNSVSNSYGTLLQKAKALVDTHKSSTMESIVGALADKPVKKNLTVKKIEVLTKDQDALYEMIAKSVQSESSNNNAESVAVVSGNSDSPKSARIYAQLAAEKKLKEKTKGVADPARAASIKAVNSKIADVENKGDSYIAWNQSKFDQWLMDAGEESRGRMLEEILIAAAGGKPSDVTAISRGAHMGRKINFQELRFFFGDLTLRVYGVMHEKEYHILAWGDKNTQDRDILLAVSRYKELLNRPKKQAVNAPNNNNL